MADESKRGKTRINIEVTERDIERAHRNDSYTCVVSQAIARAVPDATRIEVDAQLIRFTRAGIRYAYLTPYAVQGYVIAFDAGDAIEPFSFQLRDPKKLRRHLHTEAGKAIDRIRKRERRKAAASPAANGSEQGHAHVSDATKSATGKKKVSELEEVKAAYAGAAKSRKVADGGDSRRAPPRVFKKKRRSYGHRLLRINQEGVQAAQADEE